jgi:hypothetical protein
MDVRRKITKEIEKQELKIAQMRTDLAAEEAYLRAQQDMLKLLPRDSRDAAASLRANTDLAKARDIIREAGAPLHVGEILKKLGREITKDSRASLAGSIGWYVRRDEIFTRPAPNTFGLREFNGAPDDSDSEPPEDFGIDKKAET